MRGFNRSILNFNSVILSVAKNLVTTLLVCAFAASCGEPEPVDPTPVTPVTPVDPTPAKDTKAPVITVSKNSVNVISGPAIIISGNEMKIGEEAVASWKDDVSSTCKVELTFTPKDGSAKTVNSGDKLSEEGKLQLKVIDEAGNAATAEITLTRSDSEAPVIEIKIAEKNVIAGVTVSVRESQLLFDEEVAASWSDDYTAECKVELTFTPEGVSPKDIQLGDQLSEAGKLSLKVTDEFNNSASAEITLTAVAVTGLENLQNLSLQVDTPVNLLEGLTIAEGLTLQKVEIEQDGVRTEIADPKTYTPELPGTINVILTFAKPDGNSIEVKVENLRVRPLEYAKPALTTANVIDEHYPWFNNLTQGYIELGYDPSVVNNKKNFVYPHILTSYITGERYRHNNLEYIIMGETPTNCEDVSGESWPSDTHADGGFRHIQNMTPTSTIKCCEGCWSSVINYISLHPEKLFILSMASDALGGKNRDKFTSSPDYRSLQKILENENVLACVSGFNNEENIKKTLNENEEEQENGRYKSASVNSKKNNKITVVGYNPAKNNIFWDDNESAMPIGFDNTNGNIVICFTDLVSANNGNLKGSAASYPTAALSSTLGNHLSVIMHNYPGSTLEDASTILQQNYLRADTFRYKDADGTIKPGGTWYFFDSDKFFNAELLHKEEIVQVLSSAVPASSASESSPSIVLPFYPGLIYSGPGVFFSVNGKEYEMKEASRSALEEAVKSDAAISWRYSPGRARKYGVGAQAADAGSSITVRILDTKAQVVPDISFSVELK